MLAGQWEGAAACVDEGLAIVDRYGERQLEAEMRRLRGELALQRGDAVEAEAWLERRLRAGASASTGWALPCAALPRWRACGPPTAAMAGPAGCSCLWWRAGAKAVRRATCGSALALCESLQ